MKSKKVAKKCREPRRHFRRRKGLILLFLSALFLFTQLDPTYAFDGPLMVKDEFPLFLHIDTPYLESAGPSDSLSAILSYSSVYMVKNSKDWSVNLDMETTEFDLRYRKTLAGTLELGVEIPVLSFNSGFMDDFLEDYHRTFGFGDYGRSNRPKNEFLYQVQRDGGTLIQGEGGGVGLGDIRLTAKKVLLTGDPVVSLQGELELPTGSASKGYGSGGFDTGITLLADKQLSRIFKTYLNIGVVFPGKLKWKEDVGLNTFLHGGAGLEAAIWKKVSLLGQVMFQGSPLPKTGIGEVDRTAVLLALGARYSAGKDNIEFSLTEDPNTAGAPDFQLTAAYRRRF